MYGKCFCSLSDNIILPTKSRVEQKCSKGGSDAIRKMKKWSRVREDQRNAKDIGVDQAVKPVKKALNRLTKGSNEREKGVYINQDISIPL